MTAMQTSSTQKKNTTLSHKIGKVCKKNALRVRLAQEYLAGNYTAQTIDMDWKGKPLRMELINRIIAINGYTRYLEIGCHNDVCFNSIQVAHKVGVDPASGGTLRMTSDEFFAQNKEKFDIIFIDGLHVYEQVRKDILNGLNVLNDNGTIIMHDCLPTSCLAQYTFPVIEAWNGDVWKALVEARTYPNIDSATCLIDHGVGVIKKRANTKPLQLSVSNFKKLKYADLANDYVQMLNTLGFDEAAAFATGKKA